MRDVMLVESRSGAGDAACNALRAAGCRVHRCGAPDEEGTVVPCRAIDDPDTCPISIGVDVALVVRPQTAPTGGVEPGLTCALRAGVPVVEEGPSRFDPYVRRTTTCSSNDVVETCRQAVVESRRPLQDRLACVTEPIVGDDVELRWSIDLTPDRAHLVGHGPPIDARLRNRVAVRAIDAVRGSPFARPRIDVSYRSSY